MDKNVLSYILKCPKMGPVCLFLDYYLSLNILKFIQSLHILSDYIITSETKEPILVKTRFNKLPENILAASVLAEG